MHEIALLLTDGFIGGGATGMLDVLQFANRLAARGGAPLFRWRLLSADGGMVVSSSGVRLAADGDFASAAQADTLALAPFIYRDLAELEARLTRLRGLGERLHRWQAEGKRVMSHCTGVALLAESGLLEQRAATISWWLLPWFRSRYPQARLQPYAMLTEDAGVICGGATTAYLNLALRLVEQYGGADLALACARLMLVDANRVSQAPYASLQDFSGHDDELVLRCQHWLLDNLRQPYRLASLAQAAGASERTLMRRFGQVLGQTPLQYLQQLRLDSARRMLEGTALSLDEIVERVGYHDAGTFRRLFSRELRCTPAEYRRRFGRAD
ncbi:GlxA family transcriptional regulator [Chromobacterium paludis]|uniref:Helix-turn-helix domain-containing protein n=1 Tax=Chromobacterium paludis TaxID=2605945 RepID=A0A5C1DFX5_9NEIS|nr:helix-turn-helix domain-containing protein [Chromobacterium paludis]QEL54889.1 helix-turn-helix domain-containing protein [Chromobacterium paludis]